MAGLLGTDPSVAGVATMVTARASGNPFFAEEIVRDLRDRGVLHGQPGAYVCTAAITDISVPATVHAAIAARIDRLPASAKRTLRAAAVIGDRFNTDLLTRLSVEPGSRTSLTPISSMKSLPARSSGAAGSFPDPGVRVSPAPHPGCGLRIPAQVRSCRPASAGGSAHASTRFGCGRRGAEQVAEHLEAAGDLREAYAWHMRAGAWWIRRDIGAARLSWQRARQVADRLPPDEDGVTAMRIAPRAYLCGSAWLADGNVADTGFDELRDLCTQTGDEVSLAMGIGGQVMARTFHNDIREASRLATDFVELLESSR